MGYRAYVTLPGAESKEEYILGKLIGYITEYLATKREWKSVRYLANNFQYAFNNVVWDEQTKEHTYETLIKVDPYVYEFEVCMTRDQFIEFLNMFTEDYVACWNVEPIYKTAEWADDFKRFCENDEFLVYWEG